MTDRVARTLLVGLLIVWAGLSRARLRDWESDRTLWAAAVQVSPTTRAMVNYSSALIDTGHWDEAKPWMLRLSNGSARGKELFEALTLRARFLGYPVCDDAAFAASCR